MLETLKKISNTLANISYKNHRIILFTSLALLIVGPFFLKDLEIEPTLLDSKGLHGREFQYFIDNFKRFGESTPLVLLQQHPLVDEEIRNKFTDALVWELRSMEEITYVQSGLFELSDSERLIQMIRAVVFQDPDKYLTLFSQKFTDEGIAKEIIRTRKKIIIADNPVYREMIAVDIFHIRELLEPWLKDYMANFKISHNSVYFDSEDQTSRLIFAQPKGSGEDTQFCIKLTDSITSKIEEIKSSLEGSQGITCEFAGKYGLTAQTYSSLNRELIFINIISSILIFVLLVLVFRNIKVTLMCFLPIFFSVYISLLAARLFFNPLKMISVGFAAIVLGLGVDITFHLSTRFFQYRKKYSSLEMALKKTLNDCGSPLIIGIFTTGCGFFILSLSHYSALRQFGILTFISLLLTLVVTLLLFPSIVRMLQPKQKYQTKLTQLRKIPSFFYTLSMKKVFISRIATAALIMAAIIISTNIRFDMSLSKLLPQKTSSLKNSREVSEKFGTSFLLSTQITVKTEQLPQGILYQRYLDKTLNEFVKNKKIAGFYSPTLFYIPYEEVQKNLTRVRALSKKIKEKKTVYFEQLNANGFNILPQYEKYYELLEEIFNENTLNSNVKSVFLNQFLKREEKDFYLQTYVWHKNGMINSEMLLNVSEDLKKIPARENIEKELTGTYQVHQAVNKIIKKDFVSISLWAGGTISLILLLFFRKFKILLLSLLPLFGAIPFTLAFVQLTSIEFSPALIGVVAIIIGIGIDDAVHLIHRKINHPEKTITYILSDISPVLTLTSVSTAICFLTLILSSSPLLANTGAIVGVGVLSCWFFTMFLLPPFLKGKKL
jgi:predicted RND superfamily exporter protein